MIKEIISFDLCGKMAHFRKFYASSSALSHTIPPKTTILGIIAATLGLERDSYYNDFDDWLISIQIISPIKKIFQKFNYLKVENNVNFNIENEYSDVNGFGNRTQISVELVTPQNIRQEVVKYRIFIGVKNTENKHFQNFKKCLKNKTSEYGVSLGTANFIGYFENYIENYLFSQIQQNKISLKTIAITENIELHDNNAELIVEQDIFPIKMNLQKGKNENTRIASETKSLIYPLNGTSMILRVNNNEGLYKIINQIEETNIALI